MSDPAFSVPAAVLGFLDEIGSDGEINGWCWAPQDPASRRQIRIEVNGSEIQTLTCDGLREDLRLAGMGDGKYGFHAKLPSLVALFQQGCKVAVRDVESNDIIATHDVSVPERPRRVSDLANSIQPRTTSALRILKGFLENVTEEGVANGWAWCPDEPETHLILEIRADNLKVATAVASGYREDLNKGGVGKGDHAFTAILPWSVISENPVVRISIHEAESGTQIGDPFVLQGNRVAILDLRIRDLERQVRLLGSHVEEIDRSTPAASGRTERELFETIGAFFLRLADGEANGGAARILGTKLAQVIANYPVMDLKQALSPVALICINGNAPLEALYAFVSFIKSSGIDNRTQLALVDPGIYEEVALLPAVVRNLRYLRLQHGQTICHGWNDILRSSAPVEFIVFLSPYVRLGASFLDVLSETFSSDLDIAMLGCPSLRSDGKLHHYALQISKLRELEIIGSSEDPTDPAKRFMCSVDALTDLAFAVRFNDLIRSGGFSGELQSGLAAVLDFGFRVQAVGQRVVVQPHAAVQLTKEGDSKGHLINRLLEMPDGDLLALKSRWLQSVQKGSQHLGHALVIDDTTPRLDQDAGSTAIFEQMLLIQKLDWHVSFAAMNNLDYDDVHSEALQRRGIEVIGPPYHSSVTDYLERHGDTLDLVIICCTSIMAELKPRIIQLAPQAKLIFVLSDLDYLGEKRTLETTGIDNKEKTRVATTREQELAAIRSADATIISDEIKMESFHKEGNERLWLLRWITEIQDKSYSFESRSGLCFIGAFNYLPNVDGVLWFVREVMPILLKENTDLHLYLIGNLPPPDILAIAGSRITIHRWVPDLAQILRTVRLSIAPLRIGAGLKAEIVTSLSYGVPVVATSAALDGSGLGKDLACVHADTPKEFAEAVLRLHEDEKLWREMSHQAIKECQKLYSRLGAMKVYSRVLDCLALPWRSEKLTGCPSRVD